MYCSGLKDVINNIDTSNIEECSSVIVKGTEYKNGNIVILGQDAHHSIIQMGKIVVILTSPDCTIYLVVEKLQCTFYFPLRIYEIKDTDTYQCIDVNKLCNHQSLYMYTIGNMECVRLSHRLISSNI